MQITTAIPRLLDETFRPTQFPAFVGQWYALRSHAMNAQWPLDATEAAMLFERGDPLYFSDGKTVQQVIKAEPGEREDCFPLARRWLVCA